MCLSMHEWIKKIWYVCVVCVFMCINVVIIMMEYYLATKRGHLAVCTWINPDNLILSEISWIEKDDIVTEKNRADILDLFILLGPSILKSFV